MKLSHASQSHSLFSMIIHKISCRRSHFSLPSFVAIMNIIIRIAVEGKLAFPHLDLKTLGHDAIRPNCY